MIVCLANRSIHQHPDIDVAVTHDEDWMEVTKDILPDQWPDGDTLTSMALDKKLPQPPVLSGGQPLSHITNLSPIALDRATKHAARPRLVRARAPYAAQACDVCRRK